MGLSFTIQNKLIKNVTGGAFIVIKITDKKPNVLDETFLKT